MKETIKRTWLRLTKGINLWGKYSIGEGTTIGNDTEIAGMVGSNCSIQAKVFIPPGVYIGDNVFIGPGVIFTNCKYPTANRNNKFIPQKTFIGDNAKIGAGCIIMPGINIGYNSEIGAGTVVLKNVPSNTQIYQKRETVIKPL